MTDRSGPLPRGQSTADDETDHWREAAQLRRDHPRWIVIWLAPIRQFRAYARLHGARRDTAITASTPAALVRQIGEAEQAQQTTRCSKDRM
jgi:hypothetical protein